MHWLVAILLAFVNLSGIALAVLGLPGIWLMLLIALLVQWWRPDTFSMWTLGVCAILSLIAEAIEFASGALGARHGGGGKSAGTGAIVGGLVGAIAGAAFPPVLGAIIWGAIGAGLGAVVGQLAVARPSSREMMNLASTTAAGKALGTISKGGIAVVVYVVILVAALVP